MVVGDRQYRQVTRKQQDIVFVCGQKCHFLFLLSMHDNSDEEMNKQKEAYEEEKIERETKTVWFQSHFRTGQK